VLRVSGREHAHATASVRTTAQRKSDPRRRARPLLRK
jgi:hypothetical protein